MAEWIELDDPNLGGCRQCCTVPHGRISIGAAATATLAWIFSMVGVNSCRFLKPNDPGYIYCHPAPDPTYPYGTCGDCHCITGVGGTCPSDPKEIPLTDVDDDWLRQLKAMKATNPYEMVCNPYNTTGAIQTGNCTVPAQNETQLEMWETAACGIIYNMSSLDEDQCPTEYSMKTYDSKEEMLAAGAEMTHWGACGSCSTTVDLAVYLEHPDLTAKGQECSIRALTSERGIAEGIECFQEVGYTYPCAEMWMYNVYNTRDNCFDTCLSFTIAGFFQDDLNNSPPPDCKIQECLLCDETMSGPGFQTVAARSRRRSGLLSKIVRDCDNLLIVDHKRPCDVTRAKLSEERRLQGQQSSVRPEQPEKWRPPEPTETCVYIDNSLGLMGYSSESSFSLLSFLLTGPTPEQYKSLHEVCYRYDFSRVLSGYWAGQREIFGAAYRAAVTFGLIVVVLGGVATIFSWCTMCVAFHPNVWKRIAISHSLCGLFMWMTMLFFSSGVCMNGCTIEKAGVLAILAGFLWIFSGALAFKSTAANKSIPKATCCCCPVPITGEGVYSAVPTKHADEANVTEVIVTESTEGDGSKVVVKTIQHSDGSKSVERTIYKKGESNGKDEKEVL